MANSHKRNNYYLIIMLYVIIFKKNALDNLICFNRTSFNHINNIITQILI